MAIQEPKSEHNAKTNLLSLRQIQRIYRLLRQHEYCQIRRDVQCGVGVPYQGVSQAVAWNLSIPELRNGDAGEDAAEEEPCSVGDDDSEEDVAAISCSRGVEEAEVEKKDGYFGEGEAEVVGQDAEVEWLGRLDGW